ncbi:MAG: DUF3391 domain-containing protein [Candidatus Accumulibacter sp.]|uniref:HD-GYP domain-containing protein n=1 Tax=Accumulibacter sp. TaxID=2053492 RepID=UPI001A4F7C60|nr:HD-GYP domain-containing protein [Accumulibacter sp.]MBL8396198.1 DUF3391 domain-containing protein [Accumulibacter sp.]
MSSAPDETGRQEGEILIDAAQLRPGVHVRLPVPWIEHQFMFSSFVIVDEEQARLIAAMKLPQLFCDPMRCRVPPLPPPSTGNPATCAANRETAPDRAHLAALTTARLAEKQARSQAMERLREGLDKAQKHYLSAARAVAGALAAFAGNPCEAIREVARVSEDSTAALLADPDSAIVLIAEKAHQDGHAAHSLSVMTLSLLLGKQAQLPPAALQAIGIGALLHDIGKLQVNPAILRNNQRNRHEEAIYQSHCRSGFDAAARAGSLAQSIRHAILHHHERYDGQGFPDRLSANAVPLAARVVAIANRFDNLVNPPDHRRAISPSEALSTLWMRERSAFDPMLLQLFIRAMGVYPPGSIVQLSDGRSAAVIGSAGADKPLRPKVMVYAPEVPRRQSIIVDLALDDGLSIERPLRLQDRTIDELDYLLPRRKINWSYMAERTC